MEITVQQIVNNLLLFCLIISNIAISWLPIVERNMFCHQLSYETVTAIYQQEKFVNQWRPFSREKEPMKFCSLFEEN